ncbi:MAG: hypothetical protein JWN78_990 [Bacteroidota bacterium]|nr:hypothetical protein [Bacteroidota bacterium]
MYFFYSLLRRLLSSKSALYFTLVFCSFSFATSEAYAQLSANYLMSKDKGCSPLYVTFTNTSSGNQDSCFWNLGINNNTSDECSPSAIFNQPGVYNVTLTIFKGSQRSSITKTITVFKDPASAFDALPRTGCVPFNVQFQDLSVAGDAPINNWLWDMGDGRTETVQNPLHTYTFNGNLTVSLIVTDGNGCKNTLTIKDFITKAIPPAVDFTVNKAHTCLIPFNATFQSTVTASTPVTYKWNFGTGDSSALPNPIYAYTGSGNYNVSLAVKDENNCITVKTIPNAVVIDKFKITASIPTPFCTNTTSTPTVSSNYNPFFCNWDFGNGTTSVVNVPTLTFPLPGVYTVKMLATNVEGCRDSMQQNVTVNIAPTAAFTADEVKSCVPYTVNFTNNSLNGITYKWIINSPNGFNATSTNINPSFALPKNGVYDVSLIVTSANGCVDKLDMPQYIWIGTDQINANADIKEGCVPLKVHFNANLTHHWIPKSIVWDFGDGTTGTGETPVHTYTTEGDYYVKVKVLYDAPCDSLEDKIGPIHVGVKVPFSGTFDYNKVCVHREMVTYTASGGRPTTEFIWLFGDGTGQGRTTTHVYQDPSEPKTYLVQLIAINNYCRDTLDIKDIFVAYPKASFNYTSTCNSQTVGFENTSKGHTSATWYFGDGTTLSTMDQNVSHTYGANITQVTASLVVYNNISGCMDTVVKTIKFASIDSVKYTLSKHQGCKPLQVLMSVPKDTNIINYIWEQGNGTLGFGSNYLATYPDEGQFIIKLFVKYKNGCLIASAIRDTVTVLASHANFNFDKNNGCIPAIFNFTDSSYSKNSSINSYTWKFDNNTTATGTTVSHAYNAIGTFPVRLTVQNQMGCKDSITKNVNVATVKADFDINVNDVCSGRAIKFINKSSSNAVTYLWDFGDGTTSTDSMPVHAYSHESNFTVTLKVSDGKGCENIMVKSDFVRIKNIHVNFTANPTFKTCPDLISNFQLQAPANMKFKNIMWDFGNGNSSNDNNKTPQGVYTRADSFNVKLIVIDSNNCTDTIIKPNYIIVAGPEGKFTFAPDFGCAPFDVNFNATFKNTTTTIWDFGNGDTKLDRTLSTQTTYTYRREGEFTPTLVLKDDYGCTVNIVSERKINVARLYTEFNVDSRNVCNETGRIQIRDSVYSSPNSPVTQFYWTYSDSTNRVMEGVGDTFIPVNPGSYYLKLYAENSFGCINRDSIKVSAYTRPVVKSVEDKVICKGDKISLKLSGNPDFVQWSPTNSLSSSTAMNVTANPDTSTTYIIKAYNYVQCPVYDTVNVKVITKLEGRAYPDTAICTGDTVQLHAEGENTSLNISKISWIKENTLSSTTVSEPWAYPTTNTTYYALIENGSCPLRKIPVRVEVNQLPVVKAGEDHIIIKGTEVQIDAASVNQVSYVWSPDYNLSCTLCQTPMASPEHDTTYMVTAINEYGCKSKDELRIRIISDCSGNMVYVPNTFSPNGDGQNDVLRVLGPGVSSVKQFRVFNRWGQMVFTTNDGGIGWDGTFNGTELNPGVYMYYMDVECINGERTIKKGDVTLLK